MLIPSFRGGCKLIWRVVALRRVESYNTQRSRQGEPKGEAVDCVAERALMLGNANKCHRAARGNTRYGLQELVMGVWFIHLLGTMCSSRTVLFRP